MHNLSCSSFRHIPHFGPSLQAPFKEYLQKQKAKLHVQPGTAASQVCNMQNLAHVTARYGIIGPPTVTMLWATSIDKTYKAAFFNVAII